MYVDSHIHMVSRTTDDYEALKKAGYVLVVEPAFWAGSDKKYPESFLDYFNHMLEFESKRAEKYGLNYYAFIGMNAKEARNPPAKEVVERMIEYLDHPKCLGIGEIGLDLITPEEIDIFRRQVRLVEQKKMLCIIHTPHINKKEGILQILKVLKEENVDLKRYIIDHITNETIDLVKDLPSWIGITLYPTKMNAERTAEILKKYGPLKIILNSSADWGKSYPLMVKQTAEELEKEYNIPKEYIKKITYQNAIDFFSQSEKFKLE